MTNWYLCQDFHLQIQSILNIYIFLIYWERQGRGVWLPWEDRARKWRACEDKSTTLSQDRQLQTPPIPTGTQFCVHCFICCIQGHPHCLTLAPWDISPSMITEETGAWESHHDARRLKQLKTWGFHDYRNPVEFLSMDDCSENIFKAAFSVEKPFCVFPSQKGLSRVEALLRGLDFFFFLTWVVIMAGRGASWGRGGGQDSLPST